MDKKQASVFSLAVIVAALGYFVDIYDLLLFSIIRVPSLQSLGLDKAAVDKDGLFIINIQMLGLLAGGIFWGILGDKLGRLKVLYASIILYSLGNIANGFVHTVDQYAMVRFITGFGLAGELGAGITLVSELLSKEKRGIGTSLVAGVGLTGAVFAFFIKQTFSGPEQWRICYFIGGGLGFLLLLLRVGVLESGMFNTIRKKEVSRGNFLMLFNNGQRFRKYLFAILIGLPTWYVIGILISFSNKFAAKENLDIQGTVDPGMAVMFSYAAISIGDVLVGFISHWLKSRKKVVFLFYGFTALSMLWYFNLQGQSASTFYVVCTLLGFSTGFWAIFVTMAAEQFGTNIRATVATTVPNMVRGSLNLVTLLFVWLQGSFNYVKSAWVTGIVVMAIAVIALIFTEETFGKDLDYIERE